MDLHNTELCRVRAITAFISLNKNSHLWAGVLEEAKRQCDRLAESFARAGYTVQSVRLVSNPFGEYLDTENAQTAKQGLARIQQILQELNHGKAMRIRFAVGEAVGAHEIALLPELIRDYGDLCNACVNVGMDENGFLDRQTIELSVATMQEIGRITPRGEGNFNFTVNFNCRPLIPYFPAGYHRAEQGNCIVLGLETPDLLAAALRGLNNQPAEHAQIGRAHV